VLDKGNNVKRHITAIFAVALAGCATTAPTARVLEPEKYAADATNFPGLGTVYLLRGPGRAAMMATFEVRLDGKKVGAVRREQFLAIAVSPGPHQIFVGCTNLCGYPAMSFDADFKSNRTYYFLVQPDAKFSGMNMSLMSSIGQIDPPYASRLLQTYTSAARQN
jgi:hypothetical protein